jgi:DNA-directed RNA polymerase specialized sigma subunit
MRRLYRENLQQQPVQNTEADASMFGPMDTARAELMDELERDPYPQEVMQRMNETLPFQKRIDLPRFQQLQTRRGGTALASSFESNPTSFQVQAEHQNLDLLPYDLTNQELQVYNHLFGRGGQRASTSTNAIAKRLGTSAPTVSRLRKAIALKAGVTEEQLAARRNPRKIRGL